MIKNGQGNLLEVATHEAGHAVVMYLLRSRVGCIEIYGSPETGQFGGNTAPDRTEAEMQIVRILFTGDEKDRHARLDALQTSISIVEWMQDEITILGAGAIAQSLVGQDVTEASLEDDQKRIQTGLNYLTQKIGSETGDHLLNRLRKRTLDLLTERTAILHSLVRFILDGRFRINPNAIYADGDEVVGFLHGNL